MKEDSILHIEFLTEELSCQIALQNILPKILGEQVTFDIRVYRGKSDLLSNLPNRLKGYKSWIPIDWRIVVLIDEDRENCQALKAKLEDVAKDAGFITKSLVAPGEFFQVSSFKSNCRRRIRSLVLWGYSCYSYRLSQGVSKSAFPSEIS